MSTEKKISVNCLNYYKDCFAVLLSYHLFRRNDLVKLEQIRAGTSRRIKLQPSRRANNADLFFFSYALLTVLNARDISSRLRIVFERLPAWSYTVTDECLTTRRSAGVEAARQKSKRFSQRRFENVWQFKSQEALSRRGWKRWPGVKERGRTRGGLAVKASPKKGRKGGWGSEEGQTGCARDGREETTLCTGQG